MSDWYRVHNENEISTPALLVYPDRIRDNIEKMIQIAGNVNRLRPHVKTHKMGEVVTLQIKMGINKFKCATIAEAEMCAKYGANDILIAYQLTGPQIDRYFQLMMTYPSVRFSVLIDSESTLEAFNERGQYMTKVAYVFLDINSGMNRTGISCGARAKELYTTMAEMAFIQPLGVHVYDGHIHESNIEDRTIRCEKEFVQVTQFIDALEKSGLEVPLVVAGGTPTFPIHSKHKDREVSPGTPLLWDQGYSCLYPDLPFEHAAVLMTRVISIPTPATMSLDLGYKAVASEMPHPRIHFFDESAYQYHNHSEEHLVIDQFKQSAQVGDVYYVLPIHICPTVAKYSEVWQVIDGEAKGMWPVLAQKRRLTI